MQAQQDPEKEAKRQIAKYTMLIFGSFYLLISIFCTQGVAADCNYNPLLGDNWEIFGYHIYSPFKYSEWRKDPEIRQAIPNIMNAYKYYKLLAMALAGIISFGIAKSLKKDISHGSASFANNKDITEADLGHYVTKNGGVFEVKNEKSIEIFGHKFKYGGQKVVKKSGVVVGVNPFTKELMLHNGPEHILLMAPTRSGKGVNTIIPTGLVWKDSIFFFDPKGELWANTSGYRKNVLHQKVMKFEPLCMDGSANRWNPFAEINYRTNEEISDVSTVVSVMIKPDGEKKGGGDPFWDNSASDLLNGVIMHLMYKHHKENLPLPSPTDVMSFLASPDMDTEVLYGKMMVYPHITVDEFLEVKGKKNPLLEIYGSYYVKNLQNINDALGLKENERAQTIEEVRDAIKKYIADGGDIDWECKLDEEGNEDEDSAPFHRLLTHPKVAESASTIKKGAEQTRASIIQTAQAALAIYKDPIVQRNMSVSDFCIRDLLDPKHEVSCYLVMQVKDIATVKPISRLFINTLLNKLIRDMKFNEDEKAKKAKKQRLLLMLDEFPQLGNMQSVELALAICAGYGIKMCIVCQDVNQLNKEYTKDNSIASNCHLHIYFTPNLDPSGSTAKAISDTLGKRTIKSVNHSDGGGGFGKGSDSISSMGRELMTPDEVSRMSSEAELVFIAGHKPIMGKKLRYYLNPWFTSRIKKNPPPMLSDPVTRVETYEQLFAIHAADTKERMDRIQKIQEERERIEKAKTQQEGAVAPEATTEEAVPEAVEPQKKEEEVVKDEKEEAKAPNDSAQATQKHEEPQTDGGSKTHEPSVAKRARDKGSQQMSEEKKKELAELRRQRREEWMKRREAKINQAKQQRPDSRPFGRHNTLSVPRRERDLSEDTWNPSDPMLGNEPPKSITEEREDALLEQLNQDIETAVKEADEEEMDQAVETEQVLDPTALFNQMVTDKQSKKEEEG